MLPLLALAVWTSVAPAAASPAAAGPAPERWAAAPPAVPPAAAPGTRAAEAEPSAGEPGRVVEEVVAVVRPPGGEARVITLTKVAEAGRIALVSRGGLEAADRPLDGAALHASLEWYIDQILLHDEAARLEVFEVGRADALAALARFRDVFPRPEDYRAFLVALEIEEEELLSMLRRMLRVRRYLESRLGRVRVTDADVEAWHRRHAAEMRGRPLAEVKDLVRSRIVEERVDAETRAILADLRSRSDIRVLAGTLPEAR